MQQKMQALVKNNGRVVVESIPQPQLRADDDVIIRVDLAGLCRTDMYVAEGRIGIRDPIILGHEFSGTIEDAGDHCGEFNQGDKVTVNPLFPCGTCDLCAADGKSSCQNTQFLGVDRDGCFAGFAVVPSSAVYVLPERVSAEQAAYAEPVAASLAVLKTGIAPTDKGLLIGNNRFSQLMQKILSIKAFTNITVANATDDIPENAFDYVIETDINSETLKTMIRAVRPGGKVILKSRNFDPVSLQLHEAIRKEPVLHIVNYGSFEEALAILGSGQLVVDDLIDGIYRLNDFKEVLNRARRSESLKPFFAPWRN